MTSTVLLVADAGKGVGLGHVRRMDNLGAALARQGARVERATAGARCRPGWVVVDSYTTRADDKDLYPGPVVGVDDLRRDLDVDLVVEPGPAGDPAAHARAARVLAGPEYCLLDGRLGRLGRRPIGLVETVLVTCGGWDPDGLASALSGALARRLAGVRVLQVAAPGSPSEAAAPVEVVRRADGLSSVIADSDLVVTAAGVTMLEALALGRPAVVLPLYDNQLAGAQAVGDAGAACVLPPRLARDLEAVVDAVSELQADVERRRAFARAAVDLVDGRGADRVAAAVMGLMA